MKDRDVTIGFLIVLGILAGLFAVMWFTPAAEGKAFDHSGCQYPARSTNPTNGCDNSDPCDPQSVKYGGSGDCTAPEPTPAALPGVGGHGRDYR